MGMRRPAAIVSVILSIVIAVTGAGGTHQARADGCSISDFGQALSDAKNTFPTSCATDFTDQYFWVLAGLIALSSGISNTGGHDYINDGCNKLNDLQTKLAQGIEDAAGVKKDLNALINGLSSFPQVQSAIKDLLNDIGLGGLIDGSDNSGIVQDTSTAASDLNTALNYLTCACDMVFTQGIHEFNQDIGDCLSDGLCDFTNWLNQNVSSSFTVTCPASPPPPPVQIDCTVDPCQAAKNAQTYCDNTGIPPTAPAIYFTGIGQQPTCQGDYCFDGNYLTGQGGQFCYCPHVMQWDLASADANQSNFICACPLGTTPLGTAGGTKYVCMCPGNIPVNADGSCPQPPAPHSTQPQACQCPNNQIASGSGNNCSCSCPDGTAKSGEQCVTPCATGQVMLSDGSCCAASQATSCGVCCPTGMKPDATGSTCVAALAPTPLIKPTTPPKTGKP